MREYKSVVGEHEKMVSMTHRGRKSMEKLKKVQEMNVLHIEVYLNALYMTKKENDGEGR